MTISSIYSNQPGNIGKPGDFYMPEAYDNFAPAAMGRETLQEVTDQSKLSIVAPQIHAMLSEMTEPGKNILGTLSNNIDKLQDGFIDTLYAALAEEKVDLSEKITLRLDPNGALAVTGSHPEKERVEATLAANPALSGAFREIAAQSEVLRDITNIGKVMTRQANSSACSASEAGSPLSPVYQMSLKGEMSHFYFSRA